MPPIAVLIVAVSSALAFSFLCSIFESVLLTVQPADVEALVKRRPRAGRALRLLKREIERPIAAILILNTVAHTVGSTVAGSSYKEAVSEKTLWLFSLVFTIAVLVFTEIIPKTLGVTFAGRLAAPVTHAVRALVWILRPVLYVTSAMSKALTGSKGKRSVTSVEDIRLLAALGRSEGSVGKRVAQVIEGAASLRELTVHDVMVPRGSVAYLSATRSLKENLEIVRSDGHSRFPFTPTDELDGVTGMVLAKELLFEALDAGDRVDWSGLVTPVLVVPESKPLDQVLRLFQDQRTHMALVVDEYGGTQGVVTMEDVLEELVGEIEDESDRVEELVVKRPDGHLVVRGRAEARKVLKMLGIKEKVDVVTIGGLVAELLGRVPRVGDEVEWKGLRLTVLRASARKADRVAVTPPREQGSPGSSAPTPSAQ